jgi:predicted DNA-binding transcriptional regulator AlpA
MSAPKIDSRQARKFLTVGQLCARWGGCSYMLIERRLKSDPDFPRPRKFEGGRTRFFDIEEIERYERSKITAA